MRYYITIGSIIILCNLVSATASTGRIDEPGQIRFSPDTIIVKLREIVPISLPDQKDSDASGHDLHNMSPFNKMYPENRAVQLSLQRERCISTVIPIVAPAPSQCPLPMQF